MHQQTIDIYQSTGQLKGVGEKTEKLYWKLGIYTIEDLLNYYPRAYDSYKEPIGVSEACEQEICAVAAIVKNRPVMAGNSKLQIVTLTLKEDGASLKLTWFRMPFLRTTLKPGSRFIFRGRVIRKNHELVMEQPKIYTFAAYEKLQESLQPVYPLTKGVTSQGLAKMMRQALDCAGGKLEFLPEEIRARYQLPNYCDALECIHFPTGEEALINARKRLVFDEFFLFLLQVRRLKQNLSDEANDYQLKKHALADRLQQSLSYQLTNAQQNVYQEIVKDLTGSRVMNRLVQGDVGSGKTILALLALLRAVENGYQGALMAPTEVLARQHFESVCSLFQDADICTSVVLLTGSMTAKEKREIYEKIKSSEPMIIIGTHALIQEKAEYGALALVIIDEQHRFGVNQRKELTKKGLRPHVLVMSATPIPRTLALMLYGDMDLSVVNELPANRLPIKNCVVATSYRRTAYQFMQKEIEKGRQVYIICPMVEDSEHMDGENVIDYAEELSHIFPSSTKIAYLHGKMKQQQKDQLMEAFAANQIQILVSTTVIEVGINVPNATVMLIENAELFGLAQLHQLRGRVGRGKWQSYCIFMMGKNNDKNKERLEILNHSNDGFYVAEEDLKLRGPGDFFGMRQSGMLDFKIADIFQDAEVLKMASEAADSIKGSELEAELLERTKDTVII